MPTMQTTDAAVIEIVQRLAAETEREMRKQRRLLTVLGLLAAGLLAVGYELLQQADAVRLIIV